MEERAKKEENRKIRSERTGQARRIKPMLAVFLILVLCVPALFFLAEGCSFLHFFSALTDEARAASPVISAFSFICFLLFECFCSALLAELFLTGSKTAYLWLLLPAIYGAGLAVLRWMCGTWMFPEALLSLAFFPSGYFLCRARQKNMGKTAGVLFASVPVMLLIALVFVSKALIAERAGAQFLTDYIRNLKDSCALLSESMTRILYDSYQYKEELLSQLIAAGYLTGETTNEAVRELYLSAAENLCMVVLLLLPGLAVAACNIAGYFSAGLLGLMHRAYGEKIEWRLTSSLFGVGVFVISSVFVAFFLPLGVGGALAVIFLNLMIVYMPLMMALGVRTLSKVKWKMIAAHKITALLFLVFFIFNPLLMLSMIGAYASFAEKFFARIAPPPENGR